MKKTITIPLKEYRKLRQDRLILQFLTEAINETRLEESLVKILKYESLKSN